MGGYNFIDLTGERFGRLVVIERAENRRGKTRWLCKCDCGKIKVIEGDTLKRGTTKSCGCLLSESTRNRMKKYDRPTHRLCVIICAVISRCYDNNNPAYQYYGGRGIQVCEEWMNNKSAFYEWAYENGYDENAPTGKCTLDRIDVNGNYEPSNCRFVSMREQTRNTRRNIVLTYNGETKVLEDWAMAAGIHPATLSARLKRGWSVEDAITTPPVQKGWRKK